MHSHQAVRYVDNSCGPKSYPAKESNVILVSCHLMKEAEIISEALLFVRTVPTDNVYSINIKCHNIFWHTILLTGFINIIIIIIIILSNRPRP
jgi:hypothetical protein